MNYQIRQYIKWLGIISAIFSLGLTIYIKTKFVFESGNRAGAILLIAIVAAGIGLISGALSLPKWQGILALVIVGFVGYCVLFTPLYALS